MPKVGQTLTPKQADFCRQYVVDFNGRQAAIRAGYSPQTANEQASRLLTKINVRSEVQKLQQDRIKRVEVDADFVIGMLVENVRRSMQAVPVLDTEGNPTGTFKYQGNVANKALELLGRHLRLFESTPTTNNNGVSDNFLSLLVEEVESRNNVVDGRLALADES